jgi:hypothetical protein
MPIKFQFFIENYVVLLFSNDLVTVRDAEKMRTSLYDTNVQLSTGTASPTNISGWYMYTFKSKLSPKNLMFNNVKYRQGNDINSTRHHILSDFCPFICLEEQCN